MAATPSTEAASINACRCVATFSGTCDLRVQCAAYIKALIAILPSYHLEPRCLAQLLLAAGTAWLRQQHWWHRQSRQEALRSGPANGRHTAGV